MTIKPYAVQIEFSPISGYTVGVDTEHGSTTAVYGTVDAALDEIFHAMFIAGEPAMAHFIHPTPDGVPGTRLDPPTALTSTEVNLIMGWPT